MASFWFSPALVLVALLVREGWILTVCKRVWKDIDMGINSSEVGKGRD